METRSCMEIACGCVYMGRGGALSELPSAFVRSLCWTLRSLRPSRMAETAQKCGKWFVAFSAIYRPFDGQSRNAPNTDHGGGGGGAAATNSNK